MTYRRSLSRQLQERFGHNTKCYLDISGPLEKTVSYGETVICCINSITRIPPSRTFDIVILDEATFIEQQLVSGTLHVGRYNDEVGNHSHVVSVVRHLALLLSRCKMVFLLQHGLTEDTIISFSSAMTVIDPTVQAGVHKFNVSRPPQLQCAAKQTYTSDLGLWLLSVKFLCQGGKKLFIPCS